MCFVTFFLKFFCTSCATSDLLHSVISGVALVLVLVHTSSSLDFRHNDNRIDDESKYAVKVGKIEKFWLNFHNWSGLTFPESETIRADLCNS